MSENVVGFVDWKKRAEKDVYTFNQFDIFDRVINIKFICGDKNKPDEYVLRSDYEIYNPNLLKNIGNTAQAQQQTKDSVVIRKCRQKPSIKVQYKQVSNGASIAIDVFIQNFFMLTADGQTLISFSQSEYPLHSFEVQLGYFGQFAEMYKNTENKVPNEKQFFSLEAPLGVQTLFCTAEYTQIDKLPPDATLHIHGYVGSSNNGTVKDFVEVEIEKTSKGKEVDYEVKAEESKDFKFKNFAHYIFNNITRRFFRRQDRTIFARVDTMRTAIKKDKHGMLDYQTAQKYGVKVFLSEGIVKSYNMQGKTVVYDENGNAVAGSSFFTQRVGGATVSSSLNRLVQKINPKMRVSPASNGDYFLYLDSDDFDTLAKGDTYWYLYERGSGTGVDIDGDKKISWRELDLQRYKMRDIVAYLHESMTCTGIAVNSVAQEIEKSDEEYKAEKTEEKVEKEVTEVQEGEGKKLEKVELDFTNKALPAVYNINIDALCTIVCPFFWFINVFESVRFQTRYSLGGLTSYYADFTPKENKFTTLWQNVSFATVEDINECEIVCKGKAE